MGGCAVGKTSGTLLAARSYALSGGVVDFLGGVEQETNAATETIINDFFDQDMRVTRENMNVSLL